MAGSAGSAQTAPGGYTEGEGAAREASLWEVIPRCGNARTWGPAVTWETGGRKWGGPGKSAQTERQRSQGQLLRRGSRTHRPKPVVTGRPRPRLPAPESAGPGSSRRSLGLAAAATPTATSAASPSPGLSAPGMGSSQRSWELAATRTGLTRTSTARRFGGMGGQGQGVLGRPLRRWLGMRAACGRLRC